MKSTEFILKEIQNTKLKASKAKPRERGRLKRDIQFMSSALALLKSNPNKDNLEKTYEKLLSQINTIDNEIADKTTSMSYAGANVMKERIKKRSKYAQLKRQRDFIEYILY